MFGSLWCPAQSLSSWLWQQQELSEVGDEQYCGCLRARLYCFKFASRMNTDLSTVTGFTSIHMTNGDICRCRPHQNNSELLSWTSFPLKTVFTMVFPQCPLHVFLESVDWRGLTSRVLAFPFYRLCTICAKIHDLPLGLLLLLHYEVQVVCQLSNWNPSFLNTGWLCLWGQPSTWIILVWHSGTFLPSSMGMAWMWKEKGNRVSDWESDKCLFCLLQKCLLGWGNTCLHVIEN